MGRLVGRCEAPCVAPLWFRYGCTYDRRTMASKYLSALSTLAAAVMDIMATMLGTCRHLPPCSAHFTSTSVLTGHCLLSVGHLAYRTEVALTVRPLNTLRCQSTTCAANPRNPATQRLTISHSWLCTSELWVCRNRARHPVLIRTPPCVLPVGDTVIRKV